MQIKLDGALLSQFVVNGFVCFDGVIPPSELEGMEREFDRLVSEGSFLSDQRFENGYCVSVAGAYVQARAQELPQLSAFLSDPSLHQLMTAYFLSFYSQPEQLPAPIFHQQLDLEENVRAGSTSNSDWHFDRSPSLKCAVFFNDIGPNCGPFSVVPKTHFQTRERAHRQLEKNPDPLFVDNYVKFKAAPERTTFVVGPGSVVVFDTFLIHQGGGVTGDGRRKTMRTVTWPPILNHDYLHPARFAPDRSDDMDFETYFPRDRTGQSIKNPQHLYRG
ncbi:phytanoyl-CoA dioxygenase family protein [Nisaea acidiphila]|uniref:Phytanoyl-CoA dioxygenase family protein n=1 Tax=Nisaea acidiphila TaxID=1862145 RepID=A0A9J7AXR2_9PROT|nr:phytanoyl-CoA dioxygenase family protein [Nisaea acidiphila]UUX51862.1 phytanoyl-CoA dioxygenase family protein [Nisaea acidiphila]